MFYTLHGDVVPAPSEHDSTIDKPCSKQIHQYAARHHEEAFPYLLRAELPGLGRLLQLLRVHAFVHHACYLYVSSQGDPSYSILRLIVFEVRKQTSKPSVSGAEQMEIGIIEEVETCHLDVEQFREAKVPQFVKYNQEREAQDELECLYQNNAHFRMNIIYIYNV